MTRRLAALLVGFGLGACQAPSRPAPEAPAALSAPLSASAPLVGVAAPAPVGPAAFLAVQPAPVQPAPVAAAPVAGSSLASGLEDPDEAPSSSPPHQLKVPPLSQEELRRRFPPFHRSLTPILPMGDQMVAHGIPMTLSYFETMASPTEVLEYYAREFDKRGWARMGTRDTRQMVQSPAISATDPEDFLQMSVMVLFHGKDQPRTVVLSVADMRPEARIVGDSDLPPYPRAQPLAVQSNEAGQTVYTSSFVTDDKPRQVIEFYRMKMSQLGYAEQPGEPAEAGRLVLLFRKPTRGWQVHVAAQKNQTLVTAISTNLQEEKP